MVVGERRRLGGYTFRGHFDPSLMLIHQTLPAKSTTIREDGIKRVSTKFLISQALRNVGR